MKDFLKSFTAGSVIFKRIAILSNLIWKSWHPLCKFNFDSGFCFKFNSNLIFQQWKWFWSHSNSRPQKNHINPIPMQCIEKTKIAKKSFWFNLDSNASMKQVYFNLFQFNSILCLKIVSIADVAVTKQHQQLNKILIFLTRTTRRKHYSCLQENFTAILCIFCVWTNKTSVSSPFAQLFSLAKTLQRSST